MRQGDGSRRFPETDGLDAKIDCPSLDATLPISEIDLDVSFDSDEHEQRMALYRNLLRALA